MLSFAVWGLYFINSLYRNLQEESLVKKTGLRSSLVAQWVNDPTAVASSIPGPETFWCAMGAGEKKKKKLDSGNKSCFYSLIPSKEKAYWSRWFLR